MRTLDASCFAHSTGVPADWLELAMSLGRGIANSPWVLFFGISMAVSRTLCLIPEICDNWRAIASLKTRLAMTTTACTVKRRVQWARHFFFFFFWDSISATAIADSPIVSATHYVRLPLSSQIRRMNMQTACFFLWKHCISHIGMHYWLLYDWWHYIEIVQRIYSVFWNRDRCGL